MSDLLRVSTIDGKYTIIQKAEGGMTFLRHGEPWPAADEAFAHVGMILALAQDLNDIRRDFEIVRTASRLFEQAANKWMENAIKAGWQE